MDKNQILKQSNRIFLASPHMSEEGFEQEFIKEAFDTNWVAPLGLNVDGFEIELSEKVNVLAAAALSSGTAAIHLALKAADVKKGDIVFCPSFTFSATANPIIYQDAIPVFIDSDYETWNMDPNHLEAAFEKYPDVKAVIVVHLYGLSADMDRIMDICSRHNVIVIEDAAESLGSFYKGRSTGTIGDFGIYSFNGNKIITTSGGGMLVSNNTNAIEKARFWATQSRDAGRHYQHSELGFNYRMSNVLAGIGRGQLKILEKRVAKKKEIFELYKNSFFNSDEISFMPVNDWDQPNYWLSCAVFKDYSLTSEVMLALEQENIESRPLWKPMHMQPYFKKYDYIGGDVSASLFKHGICLPSDTKMTKEEQCKVIDIVSSTMRKKVNV